MIDIYPDEAIDLERGIYYTMRHNVVSQSLPQYN